MSPPTGDVTGGVMIVPSDPTLRPSWASVSFVVNVPISEEEANLILAGDASARDRAIEAAVDELEMGNVDREDVQVV